MTEARPRPLAELIAAARELAALDGAGLRARTRERDPAMALAAAVGEAQHLLAELAAAAEQAGRRHGLAPAAGAPPGELAARAAALGAALARWERRDEPDAAVRRAANDAVDVVDAMLAELHAVRARLVAEIRAADDAPPPGSTPCSARSAARTAAPDRIRGTADA